VGVDGLHGEVANGKRLLAKVQKEYLQFVFGHLKILISRKYLEVSRGGTKWKQ
jgi:hypothetical protein